MITKDTVQNYSKYDIFNQLEIEREKGKELRELLKRANSEITHDESIELRTEIEQALNKEQ